MAMAVKRFVGSAKRGTQKNVSRVCDTPVHAKSGFKVKGFGNKPDDLNNLPPSKHHVIDNLSLVGL